MKRIFIFLGIFLISLAVFVTIKRPPTLPISPLGNPLESRISHLESKSYVILGFAPYWNIKKIVPESLTSITHLAYFHLLLKSDGAIYTKINNREEDPGYTNYKRLLNKTINLGSKPLIITIMPESQTALISSISSPISRQKTISTLRNIINESGAYGINIDYEPLGDISPTVRDNFTKFIMDLRAQVPDSQLSISTYASAASRPKIWDLNALAPYTDYFVIMTYDYTMPGSDSAGPTSPLRGSGDLFEHDIIKNIAEITRLVPSNKILLGIPFYGYQWNTVDSTKYSIAEARGTVASLDRIEQMLDNKTLELIWDRNTLTPYGIASHSGQISQIYFENQTSIRLKLEFVESAGLGGIAIWALGYEGNNSWVWPTINELNN
jgi:spore germination protein YaaH